MSVGIVSLWHNAAELLPEFERLLAPGGWDQAILVDNASSPEAHAAYQRSRARAGFQILRMEQNDVIRGWNAGMNMLETTIRVCMANDLLLISAHWLQELTEWTAPGLLCGPFMRSLDGCTYLDGSLIAYHEVDWRQLGGLDEEFEHPGYVSDVDICWRAGRLGIALLQTPGGVLHLERYTAGPSEGQRAGWLRNRERWQRRTAEAAAERMSASRPGL